jgi:hypothetical protein
MCPPKMWVDLASCEKHNKINSIMKLHHFMISWFNRLFFFFFLNVHNLAKGCIGYGVFKYRTFMGTR